MRLTRQAEQFRRHARERQVELRGIGRINVASEIAGRHWVGRERRIVGNALEQHIVHIAQADAVRSSTPGRVRLPLQGVRVSAADAQRRMIGGIGGEILNILPLVMLSPAPDVVTVR